MQKQRLSERMKRRLGSCRQLSVAVAAMMMALPSGAQVIGGGLGGGLPGSGPGASTSRPATTGGGMTAGDEAQLYHVLDRITFGATSEEFERARYLGVESFIRLQLRPELIPQSDELQTRLDALPPMNTVVGDPRWDWTNLYADYLLRARYSTQQLNEVMTEFWSNHFDTGLPLTGGGFTGYFTSLDFEPVNDRPAVAYYDASAERPYYSVWTGSSWLRIRIDSQRGNGYFTSLDHHPATQLPGVAYYSQLNKELTFSWFDGANFQHEPVADATSSDYGYYSSFAYDSTGVAHIAYYDLANGQLKVVSGRPGVWGTPAIVDLSGDDVGWFASLEIDGADRPRVAYYDATNARLKYAAWNGASWQVDVVDATPGAGAYASLALDAAGRSAIASWNAVDNQLTFVRHDGASWGAVEVVAGGGEHASLAFSAAGDPAISYYTNAPDYDLNVVRWDGATSTWGAPEGIGVQRNIVGEYASLAFNPVTDQPALSYHNGSEFDLRYSEVIAGSWLEVNVYRYGTTRFLYTGWEALETDGLRQNALGKFKDLVLLSATSPAMMLFLNNDLNVAGSGNENYARELLELHTLGVDGGYDQTDVETVARALTGWSHNRRAPRCDVALGDFCYNHLAHDGTEKTIMGVTFAADDTDMPLNWMKQGTQIIEFLAGHPSTAHFVCGKLIQKFVADVPPAELHGECQKTFLNSDGDIRRVLETILFSNQFLRDPSYRLNKVRDPFEYVLASVRHLEADTDGISLWDPISDMGMPLYRQDVPTGWPETGDRWIGTNSFLQRWKFADALAHSTSRTTVDPYAMVRATDVQTADGVLEFFIRRLLHGQAGGLERMELLDCLTNGDPSSFDIDDPATPARVRGMVSLMLGLPVYNKN